MDCFAELGNVYPTIKNTERKIDLLVVHCSATEYGAEFLAQDIDEWHRVDNGWSGCGYHYVITAHGTIQKCRNDECEGAHAKGFNEHSLGICLIGGMRNGVATNDGYSKEQYVALYNLLKKLLAHHPDSQIKGHRELEGVNKACPCLSDQYLDLLRDLVV